MTGIPLTSLELDEIKAAADATPKGPWFVRYFGGENRYPQRIENHQPILIADTHEGGPSGLTRPLPEFIARCRTDVPNLLATIDHLTAQLACAEQIAAAAVGAAHDAGEHATAAAARLDETTRDRDQIRTAAMAREADLIRFAESLRERAEKAVVPSFGQDDTDARSVAVGLVHKLIADELTALLNGGE